MQTMKLRLPVMLPGVEGRNTAHADEGGATGAGLVFPLSEVAALSSHTRQMALIAFMQAQNCSNYVGSWRHPASATDFLSPSYYQRIARTLEDARFDMAFFDDRLAMPEIYGASSDLAVGHGIRAVKMDPAMVLMAMAMGSSQFWWSFQKVCV